MKKIKWLLCFAFIVRVYMVGQPCYEFNDVVKIKRHAGYFVIVLADKHTFWVPIAATIVEVK